MARNNSLKKHFVIVFYLFSLFIYCLLLNIHLLHRPTVETRTELSTPKELMLIRANEGSQLVQSSNTKWLLGRELTRDLLIQSLPLYQPIYLILHWTVTVGVTKLMMLHIMR